MLLLYTKLFNFIKGIIPKISETEIIALKSGGVSIDREIFKGKVNYYKLYKPFLIQKNNEMDKETNEILNDIGTENIYPNKNIHSTIIEQRLHPPKTMLHR